MQPSNARDAWCSSRGASWTFLAVAVFKRARRQPCDAYPFGVSPPLEDCDCEECPRGSTATTPSIASVGGLQINSQRLFAPKLAEGHHGGSGIRRRHGSVHGVLPREIIRRRKSIVQEQVGFLAKRVVFGSSSSCKHILNEIMTSARDSTSSSTRSMTTLAKALRKGSSSTLFPSSVHSLC